MALDLAAYQSGLLVIGARSKPLAPRSSNAESVAGIDLSRGWNVVFGKSPAAAANPVFMETLQDWTRSDATRHFSGVATYRKEFEAPPWMLEEGQDLRLVFGPVRPIDAPINARVPAFRALAEPPVREAAVVYINDRRAGSVWCPPYTIRVDGLLKPGKNTLRVEVANLALNRMAGEPLPSYQELNARYGERFQPQDMDQVQPVAAGLMGPIGLVAGRKR